MNMKMEMIQSFDCIPQCLGLLMVVLTFLYWNSVRRPTNFPPGPPTVPILGSVPFLPSPPLEDGLEIFAKKYGNVFSIKLGQRWTVFLNTFDLIKATLVGKGLDFSDRPWQGRFLAYNPCAKGVIDAHYSNALKDRRHFMLSSLKSFGLGKRSTGERILQEVQSAIDAFHGYSDKPFNPKPYFQVGIGNVICSMLFNKHYDQDDEDFQRVLHCANRLFQIWLKDPYGDYIPLLSKLPSYKKTVKEFTDQAKGIMSFIGKHIQEHKETFDEDDLRDFTDSCLLEMKRGKIENMDEEQITLILFDFFTAGSDTTTVTLQWALLYMVNNPEIQRKVQKEIDKVVGNRLPVLEDKENMPYTEAVVMEVQRMACILPLSVIRSALVDSNIMEYKIPKKTEVVPNLWSVFRDPLLWPEPNKFRPERFIDNEGCITRPEYWIPFGMGRRSCPGEVLARHELFLFFSGLLKQYNILPPPGKTSLPEERIEGGIVVSPLPYEIVAKQRHS